MANEVAIQQNSRIKEMTEFVSSRRKDILDLMPPQQVDRFILVLNNAILRDPSLAEASKKSILQECMKAAADGLVLDGREAVLNKYQPKKKDENGRWVDNGPPTVAYIPMIKGLRKLVALSGAVLSWNTKLVYQKEVDDGRFSYTAEPPSLRHDPIFMGDPGPVVAAYSVVRLKGGELLIDVMSRRKLDAIKARSKAPNGPWKTDEDEMFIKTVARHHFKSIPLGDKFDDAVTRVDSLYDMGGDVLDVEPEEPKPQPRAVANKKDGGAAAKLAAAAAAKPKQAAKPAAKADDEGEIIEHDPDTGEVHDDPPQDQRDGYNPEDDF